MRTSSALTWQSTAPHTVNACVIETPVTRQADNSQVLPCCSVQSGDEGRLLVRTSVMSCCPIEGSMSRSRAMLPSSSFQIPSASQPPPPPCPPPMAFQIAEAASEALLADVDVETDLGLADTPDADAPDKFGEVEDDPNFGASLSASSSESARER
jgi:hypothetical protein